jgi:hypothetical protein
MNLDLPGDLTLPPPAPIKIPPPPKIIDMYDESLPTNFTKK